MKVLQYIACIIVILLLLFKALSVDSSAHKGQRFNVNMYDNELTTNGPRIKVNDTVRFWNFDATENTTHRVFIDTNSDGIYDGEGDWDSGNLTYCKKSNEANASENCNNHYDFTFNETVMNRSYNGIVGVYEFVDILSNGNKFYGNITVIPDYHLSAGFQDNSYVENKDSKDNDLSSNFLLIIAASSALGSIILGGMILFGDEEE